MGVIETATVLGLPVQLLLWLFLIYSLLGVGVETVFCLVREGHLESRCGLLYLPLRPMYGVGAVASTVLLDAVRQHPIVVFLGGMLICSVVEYTAGAVCDKMFGTLSWDYRDKPLHFHGMICLEYSCYWGLLVWLAVSVLNPWIVAAVSGFDQAAGGAVLTLLLGLTLASAFLTVAAWVRAGRRIDVLAAPTAGRAVHGPSSAAGRLVDRLVPDRLLIMTFPRTRLAQQLAALTGGESATVRCGHQ